MVTKQCRRVLSRSMLSLLRIMGRGDLGMILHCKREECSAECTFWLMAEKTALRPAPPGGADVPVFCLVREPAAGGGGGGGAPPGALGGAGLLAAAGVLAAGFAPAR